ncbi:MAG: NADH-quinone oxidoreductase subunit L [Planctomycetota bacterium]|nr:MAG: NADH-quinone oxidoreductase subunit L [Planctomycetota bacterium]
MEAIEIWWIPLVIFAPLAGALLNGLFGKRIGKGFVRLVGVGTPTLAFVLSLAAFFGLFYADYGTSPRAQVVAFRAEGKPEVIRAIKAELERRAAGSLGPEAAWQFRIEDDGEVLRIRNASPEDTILRDLHTRYAGSVEFGPAHEVASPRAYAWNLGEWFAVAGLKVDFSFTVDRLAIVLMLIVTGVGSLIHLYATGYMGHESPGTFARFFTYLNLFLGAMLVLVMGSNLLLLFIGWEGVGLCSYLLIGFGYEDEDNAACGTKAFVVNRIGDLGFVLGMFTLLVAMRGLGAEPSLDFAALNNTLGATPGSLPLLGPACLLLFLGATGKSAQIPLHLWLPDAMAGPTPVSALIHAATMVTAGVYMIARLGAVFTAATVWGVPVLGIVAMIGVLTAFFAGMAALGQDDIKRVLAYSTISQLGYMFVGVGSAAMGAAVFHLVTHAFFKALLFLAAGSVIHACHSQSMREMGGLWRKMPATFWTMLLGAAALAGVPLLSGFFSKDFILFNALVRFNSTNSSPLWGFIYALGVITGLVTAVYSTRMICLTFFGEYRGHGRPHESPSSMVGPLVVLAILTVLGGLLGLPKLWTHKEELLPGEWLGPMWPFIEERLAGNMPADLHSLESMGLAIGSVAAVAGVLVGVVFWGRRHPSEIAWESRQTGALARARAVLANAWYYDLVVNKWGFQPATKFLAGLLWRNVDDAAIDRGLVDGTGRVAVQLSLFVRSFQNGQVARYAGYFVLGVLLLTTSVAIFSVPSVLHTVQRLLGS